MGSPYPVAPPNPSTSTAKYSFDLYQEIDNAIRREDLEYLKSHVMESGKARLVNLSGDPLLNVLIAYKKSKIAIQLLNDIPEEILAAANSEKDTALHVAATKGDLEVTEAIIKKNQKDPKILTRTNKLVEIPLHKAALFGKRDVFWKLIEHGSNIEARREDGANVLHCAVMGNHPKLALEIATVYPILMFRRNENAITPLQLVVTVPQAFQSRLHLGSLESFIYKWIPLEERTPMNMDEEEKRKKNMDEESQVKTVGATKGYEDVDILMRCRENFPPNYATFFDILAVLCIPVRWIRSFVFNISKQTSTCVVNLEQLKENHREVLNLISYLAKDPEYWDFISKGKTRDSISKGKTPEEVGMTALSSEAHQLPQTDDKKDVEKNESNLPPGRKMDLHESLKQILTTWPELVKYLDMEGKNVLQVTFKDKNDAHKNRWNDSPLTLGAKMGLHEFVKTILTVYPEAATYPDTEGKNVLQVAIEHGHEKIVDIVESMATGNNPCLPSWLLSNRDSTKNTILHFAAAATVRADEAAPLQMLNELQWFEKVRRLLPEDLLNSRNESEKTAQELFTENHKNMVKSGREQLMEMGKTCSSLVAAVVFASSFSIPGEKDPNGNPVFRHRTAFKVFSHAYVIGLSCASTALVLFLSLLTSPYREQDFRRSLPTKFFFATISFISALVALLVAFSCNIYLNIYGGRRAETSDIVPLVCELTIFPVLCIVVLLYRGTTFGLGPFIRHVWR